MPAGESYTATFKTPSREAWDTYNTLCQRLGTTRTERILTAIGHDFELHGTPEEKTLWQEHYAQRARPGRPRKTPPPPALNPAEELAQWAARRDEGLISDEEFQAKKAQLLGL